MSLQSVDMINIYRPTHRRIVHRECTCTCTKGTYIVYIGKREAEAEAEAEVTNFPKSTLSLPRGLKRDTTRAFSLSSTAQTTRSGIAGGKCEVSTSPRIWIRRFQIVATDEKSDPSQVSYTSPQLLRFYFYLIGLMHVNTH